MLKKKKLRKLQTINIEMQEKGARVKNQGSYREKSSSDSSVEDWTVFLFNLTEFIIII